ncbi:DMT family transporter [Umezakia ovalisporum]|jgi:drug/metabolite transporter (DMT)-like permease|uniref:DMT family transporter n=2 Tax=Umezakia ovalisporum TaxID=75695 RepID=A0AA43KE16_9CYAN|nr:DMT family transporter [Umezakia ovalisporum]MBI1243158.1 EamA family transporter [Nostoc sp. RI_552]MDH6055375.1 DMT family transporter [Umezakia ovalisporum FSS-43]MDH6062548.1 DMT family transporter [Umezakia ovalisporum FSS-62]MDH6068022.1 DMT family transporter [Umezakia ovalisporum APH033B]MDH6069945.1 DMT family transporter [Umezakia ovalisporum CobakiLakeA]
MQAKLIFTSLTLISPFFFWGTAMVAMKGIIPHTAPLFLAGTRSLPAGILILITAAIMGKPQPTGWLAWWWIICFALMDVTLFQSFLAEGLEKTTAGLGSVMIDSQPLIVALLCLWLFQEHIGLWGWLGLLLGVLGITLISLPDEWFFQIFHDSVLTIGNWQDLFASGEWLMLLAAFSMAIGTVMIRFVSKYADPVTATAWHMILGGLPLWGASYVTESQQWENLLGWEWIALGYATVFGSAIAYGLFFYFASKGNLTNLSSLTFLTPVFALLFGNIFLSENLSFLQWVGVGLILPSIYLINQRHNIARNHEVTVEQPSIL